MTGGTSGPCRSQEVPPERYSLVSDCVMLRRVLLPALALLPPPLDARLGQQMVPPRDQLLRSCDAEPTLPAALRTHAATPLDALVLLDGLSDCADCSAGCNGWLQPVVLEALGACNCVRPPETIQASRQLLSMSGRDGAIVNCGGDQWQSRSANAFHWWSPRRLLLLCVL